MIDTKYNGGEKMSSWDKLLKRFLELDYDIRFEEIVKVMKEYGYGIKQPKGGSSHCSFVKPGCSRIVIKKGVCKNDKKSDRRGDEGR